MRINEPDLHVWIITNKTSDILASHCKCMAGLGETCSHAAAVLFLCEYVTRRNNDASVTDQLAYWVNPNASKKVSVSPKKVAQIRLENVNSKYKNSRTKNTADLEVKKRYFPKNAIRNRKNLIEFLSKVQKVNPHCAALSVVSPFCDEIDRKKMFPFLLSKLYKEEYSRKSLQELKILGGSLKFNLTEKELMYIEERTRKQANNHDWILYRVGRITASNVYSVCHVKAPDSNISLIKSICYASSTQIRKKSILWGCEHEKDALARYLSINSPKHRNLQVEDLI